MVVRSWAHALSLVVGLAAGFAAGCGGASTSTHGCATSAECDAVAATRGQVCQAGACSACTGDDQCRQEYGAGANCAAGHCTFIAPGDGGGGADGAADAATPPDASACTGPEGSAGCPCHGDGSCDPTLVCAAGTCIPIGPGTEHGPCRTTGAPCDPGLSCEAGICTACTSQDGCRCTATNTCQTGLVCDTSGAVPVCRPPKDCADLTCGAHQLCQPSQAGVDAQCLNQCEPGFNWTGTACTADTQANCTSGSLSSIADECASMYRGCISGPPAHCGACFVGYAEVGDPACVSVTTCQSLACAAKHRSCTPAQPHADASCGACLPGYNDVGGTCTLGDLVCGDADGGTGIAADCAALNRTCGDAAGGATCGTCLTGFAENTATGVCEAVVTCAELSPPCSSQFRTCAPSPNAHCAGCLTGYVEDLVLGTCRAPLNCSQVRCTTAEVCVEGVVGQDASCQPQGACRADQVVVPGGGCAQCFCNPAVDTGLTGAHWDDPSPEGRCVCKTQRGYYYTNLGSVPCDEDGDGWVAESARPFMVLPSTDPRRRSASCGELGPDGLYHVRTVDKFVLETEAGESRTEPISPALELYEADRNDVQALLEQALSSGDGTVAPFGSSGRKPLAKELNSLTKACATATADFNANNAADISEWQGDTTTTGQARILRDFSYFIELHRGWYEAPAISGQPGTYHVREKKRASSSPTDSIVPMCWSDGATCAASTYGSYWKSCTRKIDTAFTGGQPTGTMDFARYLPTTSPAWRGMLHHSQFKCVQVVDTPADRSRFPQKFVAAEIDPPGEVRHVVNDCQVAAASATTGPVIAGTANPWDPVFTCQPAATGATEPKAPAAGTVGWLAIGLERYSQYITPAPPRSQYKWGCVDECGEKASSCPFCPQTQESCNYYAINRSKCDAKVDNFGELACYCYVPDPAPACTCGGAGGLPCDNPSAGTGCEFVERCQPGEVTPNGVLWCSNAPRAEVCDMKDNDCNGVVDNGIAKDQSTSCGDYCTDCSATTTATHATTKCTGRTGPGTGTCEIASCNTGWANANGTQTDGCECPVADPAAVVCGSPVAVTATPLTEGSSATYTGNVPFSPGERWLKIDFANSSYASGSNTMNAQIAFMSNPSNDYQLEVYWDCSGAGGITACLEGGIGMPIYQVYPGDFWEWNASGEVPCQMAATPGYNICTQHNFSVYVKIVRRNPVNCSSFQIKAVNATSF